MEKCANYELLTDEEVDYRLGQRLGALQSRVRLTIEHKHEAQNIAKESKYFNIERFPYSSHLTNALLKMTGFYWIGRKHAARVRVATNDVFTERLPIGFDGYTILQLSDLHVEMNPLAMQSVMDTVRTLNFDACVMTGDYRSRTYGPMRECLLGLAEVVASVRTARPTGIYGVLGNHDTIRMTPDIERMGMSMLLNESVALEHNGSRIHIAGIDDAHFYGTHDIEKAAAQIPEEDFSILLSHTPEVYRQAAHAGFDLMLSGHTHGGQICLPGGIPVTLHSTAPRSFGSGAWEHEGMAGYTSVGAGSCCVPVRLNCPPEITLHRLHCSQKPG